MGFRGLRAGERWHLLPKGPSETQVSAPSPPTPLRPIANPFGILPSTSPSQLLCSRCSLREVMGGGGEGPWRAASDRRQGCPVGCGGGGGGWACAHLRCPRLPEGSRADWSRHPNPHLCGQPAGLGAGQDCTPGPTVRSVCKWGRQAPVLAGRTGGTLPLDFEVHPLCGFDIRQTQFRSCYCAAQPLGFAFLVCKMGTIAQPLWLCCDSTWEQSAWKRALAQSLATCQC